MKFRTTIRKGGATSEARGEEVRIVEADSRFAVYEQVQKEGGVVMHIEEVRAIFKMPSWLKVTFGSGVKRSAVIRLAKNLSAMLTAGLSLSRALSVIERQSSNTRLKAIAAAMSEAIRQGSSFHEALAAHPKVFSGLFVAMARAGEESGTLADSLGVVALQMERAEELSKKIKGAMIYPAIVISAIVVVAILMLIYVVPILTSTFAALGVKVPLATRAIVALSTFMSTHVLLVFGGLAALVVGTAAFVRSPPGGALVLKIALRLPIIGELVRETYSARTARTLSSLLSSGVPVLDALTITKEVVHAHAFALVVEEAHGRVKKGEPLSAAFTEHTSLYPVLMGDMLSVGEETGTVAAMLKQIAEFYEADVAEKTKDLSTIIEPVLMLIIGAVVGVFAVAMIAPIYSLSSAI